MSLCATLNFSSTQSITVRGKGATRVSRWSLVWHMLTESFLSSLLELAPLMGLILISRFLAKRLPDLLRPLLAAKTKQQERGDKEDTKTLVVGQDVYMFLDPYPHWFCRQSGKVVKVTPTGVEAQTAGELLRFDTKNIPVFIVGHKTLVVGQDVEVAYSQRKNRKGKVVKVTPTGVEVEVADLLQFGSDGYELDVSRRDRLGFGPSPGDKFYNFLWFSAPECQPWHLDDMPFAERTVLLEQQAREVKAERAAQAAQGGGPQTKP